MSEVDYKIKAFNYLDYLYQAVLKNNSFKYKEVNQITARYAGKTVAGTIAIIKAIITAKRNNKRIVSYQFRMRHKDIDKLWNENINWLNYYQIPYFTRKSEGLISVLGSRIYIKGCYVANSNQISMIGAQGNYQFSHCIVVFEEAYEFDEKTILRVQEAIRGSKYKTIIFRTNPWFATNWYIKNSFKIVALDEKLMLDETSKGNQFRELNQKVYHYARWTINPNLEQPDLDYLQWIKEANPLQARTVYYGLPGSTEGLVFAESLHKIKRDFVNKRWTSFTAGVDVGHVSSATAAGLWALEPFSLWKLAEFYHSNKEMKFKESIELAKDIIYFYSKLKEKFKFDFLSVYVDSADPGFISLLNTEAKRMNKNWLEALACKKIEIALRVNWYNSVINRGLVNIARSCTYTFSELAMISYDEKAEDDKIKLVKDNDHNWDADMYALTPFMKNYSY